MIVPFSLEKSSPLTLPYTIAGLWIFSLLPIRKSRDETFVIFEALLAFLLFFSCTSFEESPSTACVASVASTPSWSPWFATEASRH